jgi:hypothetical protein
VHAAAIVLAAITGDDAMVSTLVMSLVAVVLVGAGLIAGRATASGSSAPVRSDGTCCADGTCTATIECKDDGCVIHWKAQDGRTGEIELSCKDGECKVVRCDPCAQNASGAGSGCCK